MYLYWDAVLEMEYWFPFQGADPVLGCRDHTRIRVPYQDMNISAAMGSRMHRDVLGCRYWARMWLPVLGYGCQYWDVDVTLGCRYHARM